MNVSLTPHYNKLIKTLVGSGRFANSSEVVRAGLSRLEKEIGLLEFERLVKAGGGYGHDATHEENAEIDRIIKSKRKQIWK